MIHTFDFFFTAKRPKFTDLIFSGFVKASNKIFRNADELRKYAGQLNRMVERDRPKGSTACVEFYESATGDSGCIYFRLKKGIEADCMRLSYSTLEGALEYDSENRGFTDVSVRLDGLFWKGGEK